MTRNDTVVHVRLAQLLTEGTSPNPRWLIKFEGPQKDEEVYEHTFGKVLESAALSDDGVPLPKKKPLVKKKSDSSSMEATPTTSEPPLPEKMPTSGDESSGTGNDSARVSAREERSRRRQAVVVVDDKVKAKVTKRARTDDDPVTKVKLLTGTLYLYRGRQRRAEFVPRI